MRYELPTDQEVIGRPVAEGVAHVPVPAGPRPQPLPMSCSSPSSCNLVILPNSSLWPDRAEDQIGVDEVQILQITRALQRLKRVVCINLESVLFQPGFRTSRRIRSAYGLANLRQKGLPSLILLPHEIEHRGHVGGPHIRPCRPRTAFRALRVPVACRRLTFQPAWR